jgi:hypothetical protein
LDWLFASQLPATRVWPQIDRSKEGLVAVVVEQSAFCRRLHMHSTPPALSTTKGVVVGVMEVFVCRVVQRRDQWLLRKVHTQGSELTGLSNDA